jgi:hypothetical protein
VNWEPTTDPNASIGLGSGLSYYTLYRDPIGILPFPLDIYLQQGVDVTVYQDETVTEGDPFTYEVSATDNVDHESLKSVARTTTIDTIPPETWHELIGVLGDNGWYKDTSTTFVTFAADGYDATSGFATPPGYYMVDIGESWQPYVGPFDLTDGIWVVEYYGKDNAGNEELPHNNVTVYVDTTKPFTDLVPLTPDWSGDWQSVDVNVALSATDPVPSGVDPLEISGVAATYTCYARPNTCSPNSVGTSVLVSQEGYTYVRYKTKDMAGNNETEKSVLVTIDKTPPNAPTLTALPEWNNVGDVALDWSDSVDPTYINNQTGASGSAGGVYYNVWRTADHKLVDAWDEEYRIIATVTASNYVDDDWRSNTTYHYKIEVCDAANNGLDPAPNCQNSTNEVFTTVDTDKPSVTIITPDVLDAIEDEFGGESGTTDILVEAEFANTYLVNCVVSRYLDATQNDMNNDNQISGTADYTYTMNRPAIPGEPDPDGLYYFRVDCWDLAMNYNDNTVSDIVLDWTDPNTTDNAPPQGECQVVKPVTVTLSPSDPVVNGASSGVDFTQYCTNSPDCVPGTLGTEINVTAEGTTHIGYRSTDEVANIEDVRYTSVYIDTIPPEEHLNVTAADGGVCEGQFTFECGEYETGSAEIYDGDTIYVGGCLTLENIIYDATSGVDYSTIEIKSPSGKSILNVSSPGPSDVDFASVEMQLAAGEDNDGVCNRFDLCEDTDLDEMDDDQIDDCGGEIDTVFIPANELNPNHYADMDGDGVFEVGLPGGGYADSPVTLTDTFGCSCKQILDCKPGNNAGEFKYGCSTGTINSVWIPQQGWAPYCGEEYILETDTDGDGIPDETDPDADNDGIPNDLDAEPTSTPNVEGRSGTGIPDKLCEKNPSKC